MRIGKPWLTAGLFALAITLSVVWLPYHYWQTSNNHEEVAVFQPESVVRLTNSNLVDVLIGIRLHERISKAEWSSSVLSIELRVNPGKGRPEAWFKDVEKLIFESFSRLQNVKRMLIRIVETREAGGRLLAAVDVRSTDDWLREDMDMLKYANIVHDELWRERLRISFTSAWGERFGPVKGYSVQKARETML